MAHRELRHSYSYCMTAHKTATINGLARWFNSTPPTLISRDATFASVTGIASNVCDNGDIQPGAAILSFPAMKPFFSYVKSMLSTSNFNRFFDHKGKPHIIQGTTDLQQGDPLSMQI